METPNRPEEAPRDEKQRLRIRSNEKSREEGQQEHTRGDQDGSLAPEKLPRDPQEHAKGAQDVPRRPPRAPKRGPRERQDVLKTTFGSKTSIFQKSSCRLGGSSIFEGRKGHLGDPKSTTRGPKRRKTTTWNNITRKEPIIRTTRAPKRNPRWSLGFREAPKIPSRAPQRSPRGSQDTPKSAQKMPKRAPRRSQDHLRIEDVDFSKIELPLKRELDFGVSEGHLGNSKSTPIVRKRAKTISKET